MRVVIEKVAQDCAAEIMKHHKKNLVRLVLRNPELLRSVAMEAMKKTFHFFLPKK